MRREVLGERCAVLLLVLSGSVFACGDDEPAGAAGAGGAGPTSSSGSTSATGPTSTSSSTAAAGGAPGSSGNGGEGGEGTGGRGGEGGGPTSSCEELGEPGPPLLVRTVDETGAPVPAEEVWSQPAPADPFWLEATLASCASGGEPPCAEWIVAGPLPARSAITAWRETEADPTAECFPYASSFVQVHAPQGDATARQLVHLTLPADGLYCVGGLGGSSVNHEQDEQVDDADCLVPPPEASGPLTLSVQDQEGAPVPASYAAWYYPPEGPDFDGEHPLACATQRCDAWVMTESPRAGTIYVTASYAGPANPFFQQGWSSSDATPLEIEVDDEGRVVPRAVVLTVDTTLEGAIGG